MSSEKNNAVDRRLDGRLARGEVPGRGHVEAACTPPPVPAHAPAFVKDVLGVMIANRGDDLPVSALPVDGTFPTGTTQYEKRSIAQDIPIWDPSICIQCGICSLVCPHAAIRMKVGRSGLAWPTRPRASRRPTSRARSFPATSSSLQVAPDDCTGCGLCTEACPAKDKERVKHKAINMEPKLGHLEREKANWDFFLSLPEADRAGQSGDDQGFATVAAAVRVLRGLRRLRRDALRQAAHAVLRRPDVDRQRHGLLVDLRRQPALHALLPNEGRTRPTWSNSLFEDAAEFGFGFRLAVDQQTEYAQRPAASAFVGIG